MLPDIYHYRTLWGDLGLHIDQPFHPPFRTVKCRPLPQRLASDHRPVSPTIPTSAENGPERDTTGLGGLHQGLAFAPCYLGAEITSGGDAASEAELDSMVEVVQ